MDWQELESLAAPPEPDPTGGPTSSQALLRLFGGLERDVRVTLYRDHHAWCPYCQKVWLWLEERRVPYRVRKVTMFCYGQKETWYTDLVRGGMLPALQLDGRLITESDHILEALEEAFGTLGPGMNDPRVLPLRQLERQLFRAWCQWLCVPSRDAAEEARGRSGFDRVAERFAQALVADPGPFLLGELGTADLIFVPYVERMSASLAYYKGYLLRERHPAIDRWFAALERRSTYLGTQSDFHTHAHDLPPQMGGCHPSGTPEQRELAGRIDAGPWPIVGPERSDPETSQAEPDDGAALALARVLKHRAPLLARNPLGPVGLDRPLRCALTHLVTGRDCPPPAGSATGLRYLRDRISVPRDMPLHAARLLRRALERTAGLDPSDPMAEGEPIPMRHRRDQDPAPFLGARAVPPSNRERGGFLPILALVALLGTATPGGALQVGGSTRFVRAPWKVGLTSYTTNVGQTRAEYFFTLNLDREAGASLGSLTIQQIRGADWHFPFAVDRTRAFLGVPRREGPSVPVQATFDAAARRFTLRFPEPVPPGATVTVSVRPWTNPSQADTYLFQVVAFPAGPEPVASPVGVGTLRIYQTNDW